MAKNERFVIIGHITNDLIPGPHLGGGVSYSAVAAKRLGQEAHIITKCPPKHPYIADLENMGISVHVLPTHLDTITSFRNYYDSHGARKQQVTERQELISADDFPSFPEVIDDATVLVAPVISEVSYDLYPLLTKSKLLAVTPQGYFRDMRSDGTVKQKKWDGFEETLKYTQITVFSEEDITIDSFEPDEALQQEIVNAGNVVAVTRGENGISLYERGRDVIYSNAFLLEAHELIDFTGAGDTYATAFITEVAKGEELETASTYAAFYASLKIMGLSGTGIASIPTREQVEEFTEVNIQRVNKFFTKTDSSQILFGV